MGWRPWAVCSVIVLAAHGALFGALGGRGLMIHESDGGRSKQPTRVASLVILSPDQVAASQAWPAAASAPAVADMPAASSPTHASQPDMADAHGGAQNAETPPAQVTTAIYRSPADLDQPIRPRSAPDLSMLKGLAGSGVPIRLRLFIDSQGTVVDTQVLESADPDEVLARVRAMFLATGFTSGTAAGQPVSSYKDIEITIGTPP
ncbi:MAG: hypothetical protein ACJ8GJ_10965 [Vitreoscilla sp.]